MEKLWNILETYRYKTCHNRNEKKLFGARTKLSYYKVFHRKLISNRNEKTEKLMNKPVYLGLSILELRKISMHEVWNDYLKRKYDEKTKLLYR